KDSLMKQMEGDIQLCIQRMNRKEAEQKEQAQELEKMREKLAQAEEQIKTNESLINFLNKQLNNQLSVGGGGKIIGKHPATSNVTAAVNINQQGEASRKNALIQQHLKALKIKP